jgi:hypothetical protein
VWQIALAARVAKYGISIKEALWETPIAVLNQLLIYDELSAGRRPRWATTGAQGAAELDAMLADALTAPLEHGQLDFQSQQIQKV